MGQDGSIQSNVDAAEQKRLAILSKLSGYTSYAAHSASDCADGTPPASHDTCGMGYVSALDQYIVSVIRDANMIGAIGLAFDDTDARLASALLGAGD